MAIIGNASSPGRQGFLWIMVVLHDRHDRKSQDAAMLACREKEQGTTQF
jgi:hypothetical protein